MTSYNISMFLNTSLFYFILFPFFFFLKQHTISLTASLLSQASNHPHSVGHQRRVGSLQPLSRVTSTTTSLSSLYLSLSHSLSLSLSAITTMLWIQNHRNRQLCVPSGGDRGWWSLNQTILTIRYLTTVAGSQVIFRRLKSSHCLASVVLDLHFVMWVLSCISAFVIVLRRR